MPRLGIGDTPAKHATRKAKAFHDRAKRLMQMTTPPPVDHDSEYSRPCGYHSSGRGAPYHTDREKMIHCDQERNASYYDMKEVELPMMEERRKLRKELDKLVYSTRTDQEIKKERNASRIHNGRGSKAADQIKKMKFAECDFHQQQQRSNRSRQEYLDAKDVVARKKALAQQARMKILNAHMLGKQAFFKSFREPDADSAV
jgi:hypothetical protein